MPSSAPKGLIGVAALALVASIGFGSWAVASSLQHHMDDSAKAALISANLDATVSAVGRDLYVSGSDSQQARELLQQLPGVAEVHVSAPAGPPSSDPSSDPATSQATPSVSASADVSPPPAPPTSQVATPSPPPSPSPSPTPVDVPTFQPIRFEGGTSDLAGGSDVVNKTAAFLKQHPGYVVVLTGHTDNGKTRPARLELGLARATSVKQALVAKGVPEAAIRLASEADDKPVADNATKEGRALNRRVEILIVEEN